MYRISCLPRMDPTWLGSRHSSGTFAATCGRKLRGLRGGRLQPTILAGVIRRASERAGIEKRVTAHTLRHTAATWLRSATGDARLVAEYLGHADLSTDHRYAHVAGGELDAAAGAIAAQAGLDGSSSPPR